MGRLTKREKASLNSETCSSVRESALGGLCQRGAYEASCAMATMAGRGMPCEAGSTNHVCVGAGESAGEVR